MAASQFVRHVFLWRIGLFKVMSITIATAISQFLHKAGGCVSNMKGNRQTAGFAYYFADLLMSTVDTIAFGGSRQVSSRL